MYTPMTISGLTVDPITNSPIVILKEVDGDGTLPIWIGLLEATAIASELEGVRFSRPMTHDLLKTLIENLDGRLEKIVVDKLIDSTFHAKLVLKTGKGVNKTIDARPSDSIALAVRSGSPIFVEEEVISKSSFKGE